MSRPDPFHAADDEARILVRGLMAAGHAALAVIDETGNPAISRVAFGRDTDGGPLILVSGLAAHTASLRTNPACAFMLGDPGPKGDAMTAPRLMVKARAEFVPADAPDRRALRDGWLVANPKATIYVDLPDFSFCRLHPVSAILNAGFGRAYRMTPADLV